jgi:hypothetical protein
MLAQIAVNMANGATLESQLRIFGLSMSRPVLSKLVKAYEDKHTHSSLFPEWLKGKNYATLQPFHWRYVGKWPYGTWHELNHSTVEVVE